MYIYTDNTKNLQYALIYTVMQTPMYTYIHTTYHINMYAYIYTHTHKMM